MGTTAEKLAYLADTKTDIKNAIVEKGVEVPEGSTFRQLAQLINNITTGLSDEDLAKADATQSTVFSGKKFYAKNGTLKTGTALSQSVNVTSLNMFSGTTAYNQQGVRITGAPLPTNVTAADIAAGKKAYTSAGVLLNGTGTLISGTAYKVYTGKLLYVNSTLYLDNIAFGFVGSDGLATGKSMSSAFAGGWAGALSNQRVQLVLGNAQVISAGYITLTSSYLRWEGDVITGVDYIVFCEV